MPTQQCLGLVEESPAAPMTKEPTKARDQSSVRWPQCRAGHLSAEHRHLVVENDHFDRALTLSVRRRGWVNPHSLATSVRGDSRDHIGWLVGWLVVWLIVCLSVGLAGQLLNPAVADLVVELRRNLQ
jgi:hypothetical protein